MFNRLQLVTYTVNLLYAYIVHDYAIGIINTLVIFFTFLTVKAYVRNLIANLWDIYISSGTDNRLIELQIMRLMDVWNINWEKKHKEEHKEREHIKKKIKKRLEQDG